MARPQSDRIFDLKACAVALLCLAGAGAGAYWLYRDFNQSGAAGLGPPLAHVERRESKVRRKASSSFAWNNVQSDEKLYRKDSVQTSVGSAAAIRFNDGNLLELGENSLVVIDSVENLSLNFLKGAVVLHTADGDKRVTVGQDGKAKFEDVAIRLLKPEPLARYFSPSAGAKPVRFAWKARAGQEGRLPPGMTLEVSTDRAFRSPKTQSLVLQDPTRKFETESPFEAGTYFWRLSAGGKPLTDIGQFRVIGARPLEPVSPVDAEKLTSFGGQSSTQFRWLPAEDVGAPSEVSHELQIARDAAFRTLVAHQGIAPESGQATIGGLGDGAYYWRIQSRYGDLSLSSRVERFGIVQEQRPSLALTQPEDKKTVEQSPQIRFSWSSDAEGLQYGLQIQSGGKDVVVTRNAAKSFVWKNPPAGLYRWRVAAFHGEQGVGETAWRDLSVFEGAPLSLKAPAAGQDLRFWAKKTQFDFEWSSDDLLGRQPGYAFLVVLSRDPEFKSPVNSPKTRVPRLSSAQLRLDDGEYFWRVQVVNEAGAVIKSSPAQRFSYGVFPLLAPPAAVSPDRQAVFNILQKEENPVAHWSEVKDAQGYEVSLYALDAARAPAVAVDGVSPPPGSRLVGQTVTDQTSFEFKRLGEAKYYWVVRAIDPVKRRGLPMAASPFSVTYGQVLGSPKVTSPEVQ